MINKEQSILLNHSKFINRCIILILLVTIFKDTLTGYPFFSQWKIRYIDDIVVSILWLIFLIDLFHDSSQQFKFLKIFIVAIFIFFIFQTITTGSSFLNNNIIFLIRDNVWYLPIFYLILKDKSGLNKYNKWIYFFLLTQIIFVFGQTLYFLIIHGRFFFGDNVSGTLGFHTSHILSYLLVLFIPWIIFNRKYWCLIAVVLVVGIATARSLVVFYVFCFATTMIIKYNISMPKRIGLFILIIVISLSFYQIYNRYTGTTLHLQTLLFQQNRGLDKATGGANRISFFYNYTIPNLLRYDSLLWGFGVGEYASRTAKKFHGKFYNYFLNDFKYKNEYISGGSTLNIWLGEYGIIGTLVLIIFFLKVLSMTFKQYIVFISYGTILLGLLAQKLFEEYSIGFFFWFMLAVYLKDGKPNAIKENTIFHCKKSQEVFTTVHNL